MTGSPWYLPSSLIVSNFGRGDEEGRGWEGKGRVVGKDEEMCRGHSCGVSSCQFLGHPSCPVRYWYFSISRCTLLSPYFLPLIRPFFAGIPLLTDMAARLAFMDAHHIDTHVLVPLPWLEIVPGCHSSKEK